MSPLPNFDEEDIHRATMELVHTAERQGSTFASSVAEGFAEDWLTWGGVDVRSVGGVVIKGVGLVQTLAGGSGGGHTMAVGDGMFASWIASMGVKAGQKLAAKKVEKNKPESGPATEGEIGGPVREVTLTPEPDYSEVPKPSMFVSSRKA